MHSMCIFIQTPQLPNLAQAALQRLAAAGGLVTGDGEGVDSPDDFRPLKKRRIAEVVSESEEEQEVGLVYSRHGYVFILS